MSKVLLIDNYDSFTYNVVEVLRARGYSDVEVKRNDKFELSEIANYEKIVLSPGPGIPSEAGKMCELIKEWGASKPILGICLGHQGIAEVYGGQLRNLDSVVHGKAVDTIVIDTDEVIFSGLSSRMPCGRYHSWVVERSNLPKELRIIAEDDSGEIMAIRHEEHDVVGVQFHPESVLTPDGAQMLENWIKN